MANTLRNYDIVAIQVSCPEIGLHKSVTKWKDFLKNNIQSDMIRIVNNLKDLFAKNF